MNTEGKVLAIIGAGEGARPVLSKAKEIGVKTLVFARNDSSAKELADIFIEENFFDVDFMEKCCRDHDVCGVMPSSELSTEVAARLANKCGLPGNDIENGFGGKNKFVMRTKAARLSSVKQPRYQLYQDGQEVLFPVVVKSVDSCGKRGVSIAYNEEDLRQAVLQAGEYSSDGGALLEEYINGGQEYSVECLSYGKGKHQVIQYTQKESAGPPHFVEIAHHQPANLSEAMKARIDKAAWDILEELGLTCGMAHLEIKVVDNEIYFIEVGARGGGDHISDTLTPLSTGFDYYKAAIECHLGSYEPKAVTSQLYTGIYFHSKHNEYLRPLFDKAKTADWCIENTIKNDEFGEANGNIDASNTGYFIYSSDHKIGLSDCTELLKPHIINGALDSYELIKDYCRRIDNYNPDTFDSWYDKIIGTGNVIVITYQEILAFLLLYCNHKDTLDGYICNVYVLDNYRGLGLSVGLLDKAVEVCRQKGFNSVSLHVDKTNTRAIGIYEKYGFIPTGLCKTQGDRTQIEMRFLIRD